MAKLLLIDDEQSIQHAFKRAFGAAEIEVISATDGFQGIEFAKSLSPDVIVVDVGLPDYSGLKVFRRIREVDQQTPVIFITGHGSTETAIEAVQLGAFDYLFKPLELDEVRSIVDQALQISRSMRTPARITADAVDEVDASVDLLVGRCRAMKNVYRDIGRVAAREVTVLVLGESGTGKELIARAIFQHSKRSQNVFRAVNCAAIPESLLESELFGHEKGAFTGAEQRRIGLIEQCSGGTLFLDEIGDMTPLTQSKILRFLQEREFERVGGNQTIKADVRIVAATNRNLEEMVAAGEFRGDLFYRLNSYTIELPPLRERERDIDLLAHHFLRKFSQELDCDVTSIAPEAIAAFHRYPWPGNVREFESVIRQGLLTSTGPILLAEFLPAHVLSTVGPSSDHAAHSLHELIDGLFDDQREDLHAQVIGVVESQLLQTVMARVDGNLSKAARILGITRVTLRNKLKELGKAESE